jgi:hypothetical protein
VSLVPASVQTMTRPGRGLIRHDLHAGRASS